MSESARGVVRMEHGTLAEVTFHPDGTYSVDQIVQKASGLVTGMREVGDLLGSLLPEDAGGGQANYRRLDLR